MDIDDTPAFGAAATEAAASWGSQHSLDTIEESTAPVQDSPRSGCSDDNDKLVRDLEEEIENQDIEKEKMDFEDKNPYNDKEDPFAEKVIASGYDDPDEQKDEDEDNEEEKSEDDEERDSEPPISDEEGLLGGGGSSAVAGGTHVIALHGDSDEYDSDGNVDYFARMMRREKPKGKVDGDMMFMCVVFGLVTLRCIGLLFAAFWTTRVQEEEDAAFVDNDAATEDDATTESGSGTGTGTGTETGTETDDSGGGGDAGSNAEPNSDELATPTQTCSGGHLEPWLTTCVTDPAKYCDDSFDVNGADHSLCTYCGVDEAKCGVLCSRGIVDAADKQEIVDKHNTLRSRVATGAETLGVGGAQPAATNMNKLSWDEDLAKVAQIWADQCTDGHDTARTTDPYKSFPYVGQNIATSWSSALTNNKDLGDKIQAWYDEVADWPGSNVGSFSESSPTETTGVTGHYTQLVWATVSKVGCGYIAMEDITKPSTPYQKVLVCNYGPGGNALNNPVYLTGGAAGSACTAGVENGLCLS